MSYPYQDLQDPRWQKLRLQIFERDGWKCRRCGRADAALHAHHGYYENGNRLWEYELDSLTTLCKGCHDLVEEAVRQTRLSPLALIPEIINALDEIPRDYKHWAFPQGLTLRFIKMLALNYKTTQHIIKQVLWSLRRAEHGDPDYEI